MQVLLASPRGFCAGVDRAIEVVERMIDRFEAPVYVRHEIVHNRYVVDALRAKGAVFVESLDRAHWAEMEINLEGDVMGAPAYHPKVLLCAWLYGFMRGIRSSRKIEQA